MADRPPRLRISLTHLLTLVVLTCTGAVLWTDFSVGSGYAALRNSLDVPPSQPVLVVAFQERDCENNLDFLAVLQRPEFRAGVAVVALFHGTGPEFATATSRLKPRYPGVRFARLQPRQRRLLTLLGHPATPYWVLLDRSGAVRLSAPAPPGPGAYRNFAESLQRTLVSTPRT